MKRKSIWVFCGILLLFCSYFISGAEGDLLSIDMLDVGQGDAILIRTPYHQSILIDGGPDGRAQEKLGRILPFIERDIDLVILTHAHADHVNGLPEIVKQYAIGKIVYTDAMLERSGYTEFLQRVREKKIPLEEARAGKKFHFGPDLSLEILAPMEDFTNHEVQDLNDSSIVARLVYRKKSFLFTGDAGKEVEDSLIAQDVNLDSDILKVGHHGSDGSTTDHFLDEVSPDIALISVGKENRYGHPHGALLERLVSRNIPMFRTDRDGDIHVRSNGETISIEK